MNAMCLQQPGEVLARGVCGADLHLIEGAAVLDIAR